MITLITTTHAELSNNSDIIQTQAAKRSTIKSLETILLGMYDELDLDTDRLENAFKAARKSEYGRIAELISSIAKTYNWPIEDKANMKEINAKQDQLIDFLADSYNLIVTHDMLLDIKESKGYHSFIDKETYTIVECVEPEYEEFQACILEFAMAATRSNLPITVIDYKLNSTIWDKNEDKAIQKAREEEAFAQAELDKHNSLMSA